MGKDGSHVKATISKKQRIFLLVVGILVLMAFTGYGIFRFATRSFIDSEIQTREDWSIDTGEYTDREEKLEINVYDAPVESSIAIKQIVPYEYEEEGFTYYDEDVQARLGHALLELVQEKNYTLDEPLAILNPFGTGSNGLYLYFTTTKGCQVEYTVHVEDDSIADYTALANNRGEQGYSTVQEFLLIGLVPGMENQVTLRTINRQGKETGTLTFTVEAPETVSGYQTQLDVTQGESTVQQTDGLFYAMGFGDYYGYTFFFDNDGVMRYEMLLEGYHSDRFLWDGNELITCVGSNKIARLSRLGQVLQVYDLGSYELHHDINWGPNGTILALATDTEGETVEDQVLQIDLDTGEVSLAVDFTQVLNSYFQTTHVIGMTDTFFWSEGEWDWLHLNSIQYVEEDNAILVSSRETSTIIKASLEEEPQILWMIGDPAFWEGTEFSQYSLEPEGDFLLQYGQHDVELVEDESLPEGQYYLRFYDNNYWGNSTRDNYEPDLSDQVGLSMTDEEGVNSYVYFYLVDETAGTFTLADSFEVPYSSLVSNVQNVEGQYVVNNGVHQCFGEYDDQGGLIREYGYTCTANGYRVMKSDFRGFWFLEEK